jgi:hypothetical protein
MAEVFSNKSKYIENIRKLMHINLTNDITNNMTKKQLMYKPTNMSDTSD